MPTGCLPPACSCLPSACVEVKVGDDQPSAAGSAPATDDDREIWILWQDEAGKAEIEAHNADVLDRVLARLRVGE